MVERVAPFVIEITHNGWGFDKDRSTKTFKRFLKYIEVGDDILTYVLVISTDGRADSKCTLKECYLSYVGGFSGEAGGGFTGTTKLGTWFTFTGTLRRMDNAIQAHIKLKAAKIVVDGKAEAEAAKQELDARLAANIERAAVEKEARRQKELDEELARQEMLEQSREQQAKQITSAGGSVEVQDEATAESDGTPSSYTVHSEVTYRNKRIGFMVSYNGSDPIFTVSSVVRTYVASGIITNLTIKVNGDLEVVDCELEQVDLSHKHESAILKMLGGVRLEDCPDIISVEDDTVVDEKQELPKSADDSTYEQIHAFLVRELWDFAVEKDELIQRAADVHGISEASLTKFIQEHEVYHRVLSDKKMYLSLNLKPLQTVEGGILDGKAQSFLRDELKAGARLVEEILDKSDALGLPQWRVSKAKKALGVLTKQYKGCGAGYWAFTENELSEVFSKLNKLSDDEVNELFETLPDSSAASGGEQELPEAFPETPYTPVKTGFEWQVGAAIDFLKAELAVDGSKWTEVWERAMEQGLNQKALAEAMARLGCEITDSDFGVRHGSRFAYDIADELDAAFEALEERLPEHTESKSPELVAARLPEAFWVSVSGITGVISYRCPACETKLWSMQSAGIVANKFCLNCGLKLDWSGVVLEVKQEVARKFQNVHDVAKMAEILHELNQHNIYNNARRSGGK